MKKVRTLGILLVAMLITAGAAIAITIGMSAENLKQQHRINNSIQIYCIGKRTAKYFAKATELNKLKSIHGKHILVVDGKYTKDNCEVRAFLREEILSGIPVIIVNGSTDVIKNLFEGQFCPEVVAGQSPDGKPVGKETVYGYITYPVSNKTLLTKVFISTDQSFRAVREAYVWASSNTPSNAGTITIEATQHWNQIYQLDYTTGDS